MKFRYAFLIFMIVFLLQSTVLVHFSMFGAAPNLLLCLVILFSFLYGENYGMVFGVVFGLISDVYFAQIIGISALSYFLIAMVVGKIRKFLYRENILSALVVSVLGTAGYLLLYWSMQFVMGIDYDFLYVIRRLPVQLIQHSVLIIIGNHVLGKRMVKYPRDRYV